MGLARCLESGLDRGRPLLRIGAEEYVRVLDVSGAGHGGVEEGQVPERCPTPVEVEDGLRKVPGVPEQSSRWHVLANETSLHRL